MGGCERFVQAGSLEEADAHGEAPSSPYAAAKTGASGYVRMFHDLYGLPIVIARLFMVYGPGPQDENKLVPYTIRNLLRGATPTFSSGVRPVDWVYVDDVVEGLVRLATVERAVGASVDLGRGQLFTVRQAVEEIFRQLVPGRSPQFGGLDDRHAEQVRKADPGATAAVLGWAPPTSLVDGLRRTIDAFRAEEAPVAPGRRPGAPDGSGVRGRGPQPETAALARPSAGRDGAPVPAVGRRRATVGVEALAERERPRGDGPCRRRWSRRSTASAAVGVVPTGTHQSATTVSLGGSNHSRRRRRERTWSVRYTKSARVAADSHTERFTSMRSSS